MILKKQKVFILLRMRAFADRREGSPDRTIFVWSAETFNIPDRGPYNNGLYAYVLNDLVSTFSFPWRPTIYIADCILINASLMYLNKSCCHWRRRRKRHHSINYCIVPKRRRPIDIELPSDAIQYMCRPTCVTNNLVTRKIVEISNLSINDN